MILCYNIYHSIHSFSVIQILGILSILFIRERQKQFEECLWKLYCTCKLILKMDQYFPVAEISQTTFIYLKVRILWNVKKILLLFIGSVLSSVLSSAFLVSVHVSKRYIVKWIFKYIKEPSMLKINNMRNSEQVCMYEFS